MADLVAMSRGALQARGAQVDVSQVSAKLAGAAGGYAVASRRLADSIDAFITPGTATERVTGLLGRTKTKTVETPEPRALLRGDVRTAMQAGDATASQTVAAVALLDTIGAELALLRSSGATLDQAVDDAIAAVRTLDLDPVRQQQLVDRFAAMRPAVDLDAADPAWARASFAPKLHLRDTIMHRWSEAEKIPYSVGWHESPAHYVRRLQTAVSDQLEGRTPALRIAQPKLSVRSDHRTPDIQIVAAAGTELPYESLVSQFFRTSVKDTHGKFATTISAPALFTPLRDELRAGAAALQTRLDGPDFRSTVRDVTESAQIGELLRQTARNAAAARADETARAIEAAAGGYESAFTNLALPR